MGAAQSLTSLEFRYGQSHQYFEDLINTLDSQKGNSMDFSELERELEKRGKELMRKLLQEHINNRSPGKSCDPVKDADGVERTRTSSHDRQIETIFGRLELNRQGYGQEGCDSLHPLDAELNIPPEKYSLELRRRVAEEAAKNSFDDVVETISKTTGAHVPKRQAEELVLRSARDFDAFYERRKCRFPGQEVAGSVLAITVDGKGVVLHEKDLRENTRKAAEKRRSKMGKRLSKGEKKNAKRMATVAAVFTELKFEKGHRQGAKGGW